MTTNLSYSWTRYEHGIVRCAMPYTAHVYWAYNIFIHDGPLCTAQTHNFPLHIPMSVPCNDLRDLFYPRRLSRGDRSQCTSLFHCALIYVSHFVWYGQHMFIHSRAVYPISMITPIYYQPYKHIPMVSNTRFQHLQVASHRHSLRRIQTYFLVSTPVHCDTTAHGAIGTSLICLSHKHVLLHPSTFYQFVHIALQPFISLLLTF